MRTAMQTGWVAVSTLLLANQAWGVERQEIGPLVIEDIPDIPERIAEGMQRYQNTRAAEFRGWAGNPDGMLITTRFGQTAQVHLLERPGGAREQLTFFAERITDVAPSPDPDRPGFLFAKDLGGGEDYQLFWFDLGSRDTRMITDGASRNGAVVWSGSGDQFAYFSTRRNGTDWDIYVAPADAPEQSRLVLDEGGTWYPIDFSPDGDSLLVKRYISINESYLYLLDIASGERTQLNPDAGVVSYGRAVFSKDGLGIYYTSDENSEFRTLRYINLDDGTSRRLRGYDMWDVGSVVISNDGRTLAYTVNEDGTDALYTQDTGGRRAKRVGDLPVGVVRSLGFHPDSRRLAMVIDTAQSPGDVYVLDVRTRELERWSYSEVGGLRTDEFATPELIRYPTFDQTDGETGTIPAFYYRPTGDGPFPVIINIHGGPESQYRPRFFARTQYYVNEPGIAVIAPNVRGSAGYGKSYLKLDNGLKRKDSVRDIGALLDWIDKQPELDSSRVAVVGGSYGGYMVLASMADYDARLACGVDVVGISNFVTFLENTRDYRRDLRRAEYGDERDPQTRAFLERISPTTNAQRITKPLFVVQGLNDPRVPVTESEQMVDEIRANDGAVWYLMAKNEGHGFRKKANRDYYANATALFLEQCLKPES